MVHFTIISIILFLRWNFSVSQIFKPIIYPLSSDSIVTPPRDMSLGCEGDGLEEQVTWTLPDNDDFWTNKNFARRVKNKDKIYEVLPKYFTRPKELVNITYMNITEKTNPDKINAAALLILKNFTINDVGYYYCHFVGSSITDTRTSKIFVFIRDANRLSFLEKDKTYLLYEPKSSQNMTLPCIPTSPNITVTLKASSTSRGRGSYTEISSEIASYSSHEGFTLKIAETSFDLFTCEFKYNDIVQNISFEVNFVDFNNYLTLPHIDYKPKFIIKRIGESLNITCTLPTDMEKDTGIEWILPDKLESKPIITNTTYKLHYGKLQTSNLYIQTLRANDTGQYICKMNSSNNYDLVVRKYVLVDAVPSNPVINATSILIVEDDQSVYLDCEGKQVFWKSPESVSFSGRFYLNNYSKTGYYYCTEGYSNPQDDPYKSSKVFVYIKNNKHLNSNPQDVLKLKANQYDNFTIPCIPSSPDINVTLIDTKNSYTLQEIVKYVPEEGFMLYLPEDDILYLTCVFEKDGRNETQDIIVDVHKSYKYEFVPFLSVADDVFNFLGGDMVLMCTVIVTPNFFPNILWSTPNQPEFLQNRTSNIMETSYMINYGKVIVSTLTIKDVKLGDFREYECSLKDNKNKTRFVRKPFSLNIEFNLKPIIDAKDVTAVGENYTANCTVRVDHNVRFTMQWKTPNNLKDKRISITPNKYNLDVYGRIGYTELHILNVSKLDKGNYTCIVKDHKNNTDQESIDIKVNDPIYPNIYESVGMGNTSKIINAGQPVEMKCDIHENDIPTPTIMWYKDNKILNNTGKHEYSKAYNQKNDSGVYSCNVTNRLGMTSNWLKLEVKQEDEESTFSLFVIIICILSVTFLILTAVFSFRVLRERHFQEKLKTTGLVDFEKGQVQNLNPKICISDQAELLPYNKKWEIPRDRVKIGKQLGQGQFGVVMKGEVCGVFVGDTVKTVAIKMLHRNADYPSIKALINELKIMTYIGKNLNVVNLLGACTRNIKNREILIITEYCMFGNIRNHLLNNRDDFINQIDPETGLIDINNIDPVLYKKVIPSEDELSKHMNPYININDTPRNKKRLNTSIYKRVREEINEKKEYKKIKIITTHDLLCWSFQVARGMDYLSSRRILHGDLAARNVLLSDYNVVKICDFGLAKNIYKYRNYKKKSKTPLPIKWMAIESIRDRIFSVESDVWSFGITIWEFFTLAMTPYPNLQVDDQFVKLIESGVRMEQPDFATSDIYHIMMECWKEKPSERPTFSQLVELFGLMIHENVRKHYLEMNKPYENLNITEGAPNYLEVIDDSSEANIPENDEEKHSSNNASEEIEIIDDKSKTSLNEATVDSSVRKRIKSNVEMHELAEF